MATGSAAAVLGGEEVPAIVLDIGEDTIKAGFSGDDSPRAVIPTAVGWIKAEGIAMDVDKRNFIFGELELSFPRPQMEIISPIDPKTGQICNWEVLEALCDHLVRGKLGTAWADHPLMIVDHPQWPRDTRERLVQMSFDRFEVPAVYLARAPVLVAFAQGKHTGLILEVGETSGTSIVPVYEGYMVKGGIVIDRRLGGEWYADQLSRMLTDDLGIAKDDLFTLPQEIASRSSVDLAQPAKFTPRKLEDQLVSSIMSPAFRSFHQKRLLNDFRAGVCQISELPFNPVELALRPPKYYEFPSGYNRNFGMERYRAGEILFNPSEYAYRSDNSSEEDSPKQGLVELIIKSVQACDVELRGTLMANILLTGANSGIAGLGDRLTADLNRAPTYGKVRVQIGGNSSERRFGAWIGGSILASLGTFQQLWFTRSEYKEQGPPYVERKCP